MWEYNYTTDSDELYHYGRKGMKWYQNIYSKTKDRVESRRKTRQKVKEIDRKTAERVKKIKQSEKSKAEIAKARAKSKSEVDAAKEKYQTKYGTKKVKKTEDAAESEKPKVKSVKDMSDDELRSAVNRIQLEQQYAKLNPKQVSKGRVFAEKLLNDVVTPTAVNVGKSYLEKSLKDSLGLNEQKQKSALEVAKEAAELSSSKKNAYINNKYLMDNEDAVAAVEEWLKNQK